MIQLKTTDAKKIIVYSTNKLVYQQAAKRVTNL